MEGDKFCEVCGKYLGNVDTWKGGYYSFLKTKYCSECGKIVDKQNRKKAADKYNKRKRKKKKIEEQNQLKENNQVKKLSVENELLRKQIIKLREQLQCKSVLESSQKPQGKIVIHKKHK